jgi:hypothetical protein
MGTLMLPKLPLSGLSNAGCFIQLLEKGDDNIGNMHVNFFGKTITDPSSGNVLVIDATLLNDIIANPVGLTDSDPFKIVALNPLDSLLGNVANTALQQIGDLDAVATYFGIGLDAASRIYSWNDCLNVQKLLGPTASSIISNVTNISNITTYDFIQLLVNNISGLTNIPNMNMLGTIMSSITPVSGNLLISQTSPISAADFSNLKASIGPGSGTYGNPTVDDILGGTNYNDAINSTVDGLAPLTTTPNWSNISNDSGNIVAALNGASFPIYLSNGSSYGDINSLSIAGANLLNTNANILKASVVNPTSFSTLNSIAMTHNNSVTLAANFIPPIASIGKGVVAALNTAEGLVRLIENIYFQLTFVSPDVFMGIAGLPALNLKSVGNLLSPASLGFALPALTSLPQEISGLPTIVNCITPTLTGQALNAIITQTNNQKTLASNGLTGMAVNYASNPTPLPTPQLGTNTIGGI